MGEPHDLWTDLGWDTMPHHDLLIIGTGSGNSVITPELEGLDIGIVEAGTFGGTCLNVGCIPTKMLVLPADRVLEARDAARLGVTFPDPVIHWPAIRDRVFGRVDPIAAAGEAYRRSQDFVTVYAATARFVGERRLALSTGVELSADRIVLAAGSRPSGYPLKELARPHPALGLHTSDTVMRLEELPQRMVILGGGYVGCEFAHVFSALGVQVTQVQRSPLLLRWEEHDISAAYTAAAAAAYDVRVSTLVTATTPPAQPGGAWTLELSGPSGAATVQADVVLLAMGRIPNGDRLDVTDGGIEIGPDGFVVVDAEQRTTAPGVWALGDVCSPCQLKHVANHEARVVAHNVAVDTGRLPGPAMTANHRVIPHAVFGHPQVAAFGPTREELDAAGVPFVTATQAFGDVAYGWALEDRSGFLTVHAHAQTQQILAAHCLGPMASTLIQPLIQAASFGQAAHEVARGQYWIHPALAEVVENALLALAFP